MSGERKVCLINPQLAHRPSRCAELPRQFLRAPLTQHRTNLSRHRLRWRIRTLFTIQAVTSTTIRPLSLACRAIGLPLTNKENNLSSTTGIECPLIIIIIRLVIFLLCYSYLQLCIYRIYYKFSNQTVRSGTSNLDAEARQLEEAIALSLIESTRPASHSRPVSVSSNDHSYRSDRTLFEEQDPAQRILLETTHMTPEELADEKALQEAILISLRDAELEQARAFSYVDRDVAPERSASTHRTHHFQQEQYKEYFPAAVPQGRSTSTHHANHHFHQEQASEHYPSVPHEMSREHLHHSSRHIHHEPNIARYQQQHHQLQHRHQQEEERVHDHPTFIRRDSYGHTGHISHHMQVPSYPAPPARDYPLLRPPSQPISPLTYRSRSSSADSSVVDDSTQLSAGPVAHAPPPVFGHATLRAPPPIVHLDSHENPSANSSVTDQRSKVSASSAAAIVYPPPPVFGHATLRAPPPLVHLDSHDHASANSSVTDERSKVSAASAVSDVGPPPPVFGHATLRAPPPVLPTELVHNGVRHQ